MIIFTILAILAKNCPKLAFLAQNDQKWRYFAFFSRTAHQIFLIFCSKHSLWSRKKKTFSLFWEISKMPLFGQNWPKFGLNLAISGYIRPEARVFKKIFFNFFSKSKKNYFGRRKSTFFPYEHHYDSPIPTLRKILKFLKSRFFAFFSKKNTFFFFTFFSWNMVSIIKEANSDALFRNMLLICLPILSIQ